MFKNIAFIGGIHGVGKSTICQQVCEEMNIQYLSASNVLKWKKINQNVQSKTVEGLSITQNLLIEGYATFAYVSPAMGLSICFCLR